MIRTVSDIALQTGFVILGIDFSPIRGPEGNIEYLLYLEKPDSPASQETQARGIALTDEMIHQVVEDSHRAFS